MQGIVNNKNRRILVIDDNPAIHEDFRKILDAESANEGLRDAEAAFFGEVVDDDAEQTAEIDVASQGREGLAKVVAAIEEGRPYAIAFVDMRMPPGWDGLTTIEELWKKDPNLQVVICTAYSDSSWSEICDRLGKTDQLLILKKPFDNVEVCQLALALSEKWVLTQQARLQQADLERIIEERTEELRVKEASLRQKHKLEAIGSLAGGVAHEFNNLLQVIRGYARFAMDDLSESSQPYLDLAQVIDAADRAATITGQLLRFSRQHPAQKKVQQIGEIVTGTLQMVRPVIGEQIDLKLEMDEEVSNVKADNDVMSQVVLNLCINARDAMQECGSIRIATEEVTLTDRREDRNSPLTPDLPPGQYVVLSISDTGSGMSAEVRDRIFDPFFTTKAVGKGTGMGLAMVFGAVHDHEGAVTVESEEGQGSTFRIFLPAASEAAIVADEAEPRHIESPVSGETILIAEDEPLVREVSIRILREAGYHVIAASDGAMAVQKFEDHQDEIDVVLLDVVMPKLNGHQVYQQITQRKPSVKVIFCTGYDPETARTNVVEDTVAVVYKPIAPEKLLSAVRKTLDEEQQCQTV